MHHRAFLSLLIFAAPIALAQTTKENAQRQLELQQLQNQVAALPQINIASASQIFQLTLEQNMLAAHTNFAAEGPAHINVPDLPGVIRLTVFGHGDVAASGRTFQVFQQDATNPDGGQINTMIAAVGGRVIISRDSENEQFTSSIQLVQDPPPPPGGELRDPPVRLLIRRQDLTGKQKPINMRLDADNFWDLRRRNEREVDQYLRPIIRSFKQESTVFAIDPVIAWQVLGEHYVPDEQMNARVRQLVDQLGADDFRQREKAMQELKKIGHPAARVLSKMDRTELSLQQSSGVDAFLAQLAPLSADQVKQFATDKSFLLDVLYDDDATLRDLAVKRLDEVSGKAIALVGGNDAIDKLRAELMPTTQP
jgi:hypothetical protein